MQFLILIFTLFSFVTAPIARADQTVSAVSVTNSDVFTIANNLHSVKQVSFFLAFLGAPDETVGSINEDLLKHTNRKDELPRGEFIGNKFFVDGQPTSLEVTSYQPLNFSYRGSLWGYDKSSSFEKNYYSFSKFITRAEKKSDKALLRLLLPKAYAGDEVQKADPKGAAIYGMAPGIIVGVILAGFAVITAPAWISGIALATAVIGTSMLISSYFISRSEKAKEHEQQNIVDKLINSNPQITCSQNKVEVNLRSVKDSTTLQIDRTKAAKVLIFDHDGNHISNDQISPMQQKVIFSLLDRCKSPDDARRFSERFNQVKKYFASKAQRKDNPSHSVKAKT